MFSGGIKWEFWPEILVNIFFEQLYRVWIGVSPFSIETLSRFREIFSDDQEPFIESFALHEKSVYKSEDCIKF